MGMLIFIVVVLVGAVLLAAWFLMPKEKPYLLSNYTFAHVSTAEFTDSVSAPPELWRQTPPWTCVPQLPVWLHSSVQLQAMR